MAETKNEQKEQLTSSNANENVSANSPIQQQTQKDIEVERINQWKERVKRETPCYKVKPKTTEDETGNKTVILTSEFENTSTPSKDLLYSTVCAITGSADFDYASKLISLAHNGFFKDSNKDKNAHSTFTLNAMNAVLLSLAPKDEIEGMLCTRLLVLHDQYMEFMSRASNAAQTSEGVDLNVNRATKLMRVYNETLETLNRYRRKGEQKVTVQHVNVSGSGQAIVNGQINQGGGDHEKK